MLLMGRQGGRANKIETMIDALELQVPWDISPRQTFWFNRRRSIPRKSAYTTLLYDQVVQKFGIDGKPLAKPTILQNALLYTGYEKQRSFSRPKGHKLEFKRTRYLTAEKIVRKVREYFDISAEQALDLRVVRVDFAVDIPASLDWFRRHAEVKFKQSSEQFPGWKAGAKRGTRTLYFGSKTDLYRIYDKTAQRIDTGEPFLYPGGYSPGGMKDAPPPTITRIERQCTTLCVPKEVGTLRALLSAAVTFDPFARLVLHGGDGKPTMEGWDAQKWLCCLGLKAAVDETDIPTVRKRLNSLSGKKASRYFERYGDLLNDQPGVSKAHLLKYYLQTTQGQLYPTAPGPASRVWEL